MFKELVKNILNYEKNNSVLSLKVIDTLKKDIREDVIAAFNLSEPLIERHQDLYRSSTSYLDFLFKYCDVPMRQGIEIVNNDYKQKLASDIQSKQSEWMKIIEDLQQEKLQLKNKIEELEKSIMSKDELYKQSQRTFENLQQAYDILESTSRNIQGGLFNNNYNNDNGPLISLLEDSQNTPANVTSLPLMPSTNHMLEYNKPTNSNDQHFEELRTDKQNLQEKIYKLEENLTKVKSGHDNIKEEYSDFKKDSFAQLDRFYTDIVNTSKRHFPNIDLPHKDPVEKNKDIINNISSLVENVYKKLKNIQEDKENAIGAVKNSLSRFEENLKNVLKKSHLSRTDIEEKIKELVQENDELKLKIQKTDEESLNINNSTLQDENMYSQNNDYNGTNVFSAYHLYSQQPTLQITDKEVDGTSVKIQEISNEESKNKEKIAELEYEIRKLKDDYAYLNDTFSQFKQDLKSIINIDTDNLNDIIQTIRNIFENNKQELQELNELKNKLENEIDSKNQKIIQLQNTHTSEIPNLNTKLKEKSANIEQLEDKIKEFENKIQQFTNTLQSRQKEIDLKENKILTLETEKTNLEMNIHSLTTEFNETKVEFSATIERLNNQIKVLENEKKIPIESDEENYPSIVVELNKKNENILQKYELYKTKKKGEIAVLKESIQTLKESNEKFQTINNTKDQQILLSIEKQNELEAYLEEKQNEIVQLTKVLEGLKTENDGKDQKIVLLENVIKELETNIQHHENDIQFLTSSFDTYQRNENIALSERFQQIITTFKTESSKKENKINELNNKNKILREQFDKLAKEKNEMELKIANEQSPLKLLIDDGTEQYNNAKHFIDIMHKQFSELIPLINKLLTELNKSKYNEVPEELGNFVDLCVKYTTELLAIRKKIEDSFKNEQIPNKKLEEEITQLRQELETNKAQYDSLFVNFNSQTELLEKLKNEREVTGVFTDQTSQKNLLEKKSTFKKAQHVVDKYKKIRDVPKKQNITQKIREVPKKQNITQKIREVPKKQNREEREKIRERRKNERKNKKMLRDVREENESLQTETTMDEMEKSTESTKPHKKRKAGVSSESYREAEEKLDFKEKYRALEEKVRQMENYTSYINSERMDLKAMENLFYQLYKIYFKLKLELMQNKSSLKFTELFTRLKQLNEDVTNMRQTNSLVRILANYIHNDLGIVSQEELPEVFYVKNTYLEYCMNKTAEYLTQLYEDQLLDVDEGQSEDIDY